MYAPVCAVCFDYLILLICFLFSVRYPAVGKLFLRSAQSGNMPRFGSVFTNMDAYLMMISSIAAVALAAVMTVL